MFSFSTVRHVEASRIGPSQKSVLTLSSETLDFRKLSGEGSDGLVNRGKRRSGLWKIAMSLAGRLKWFSLVQP